jgi:hypothetical protein
VPPIGPRRLSRFDVNIRFGVFGPALTLPATVTPSCLNKAFVEARNNRPI